MLIQSENNLIQGLYQGCEKLRKSEKILMLGISWPSLSRGGNEREKERTG